jgi:hypothetical protein
LGALAARCPAVIVSASSTPRAATPSPLHAWNIAITAEPVEPLDEVLQFPLGSLGGKHACLELEAKVASLKLNPPLS